MQIQIKAKDYKVSPGLREFVQGRVDKLERLIGRVTDAKLELTHERPRTGGERLTAQLTIATKHAILRAEERHPEAHRAIDLAIEKMERRVQRFHSKKIDRSKRPSVADFTATVAPGIDDLTGAEPELAATPDDFDEDGTERYGVVRTKKFALKPMLREEAIDQLELLGHDFFVFLDADDNRVNVLYRRKDGAYGLIQPT